MNEATITYTEDHISQKLKISGGSTADIIAEMLNLVLVPIKLREADQILFKKHISFKEAAKILPPPNPSSHS